MASATESHSMEYETVPASTPEMVRSNSSTYPKKGSSVSPSRKGSKTKENKEKANYRSDQQQTDQHNSPVQHTEMQQHNMLPDQQIPMNIPMGGSPQMTHIQSPRPLHRSRSRQNSEDLDKNGFDKKTRGRVRIRMEFINNKLRRYTTFSKRKTGIMKKAYELSTLTGTQVMLLVASETGHVYTFATPKLQPMITSETGKALIQTCLNSPDPPPPNRNPDERMSQTGYEETELAYPVPNEDGDSKGPNERHMYANSEVSSPTQGFGTINMSHSSFPMNMGFLPSTTKQGDTNNTMAGPGYTVQQQLGPFSNLFPPPTTYANSLPPQNMTNMSHNMTTHMIRLPANMSPSHTIDLGNMVSLNRASNNTSTTVPSTSSDNATTYIYTSSPAVIPSTAQSNMETKTEIKQDSSENETRTNHDSNSSL